MMVWLAIDMCALREKTICHCGHLAQSELEIVLILNSTLLIFKKHLRS